MDGPKPTEADFTKTLAIVLLAEYFVVTAVHAASLALADAPEMIATCTRIGSLWLFAAMLAINLCTIAGAFSMRRSENGAFARTSLMMTTAQVIIMSASYLNGRVAFQAGAAALTAVVMLLTLRSEGRFLVPTKR